MAARFHGDAPLALPGRRVRDHVHQAGGGIAAVQRALRPAQHFDAVDVEEVGGLAGRARDVHAVLHEGGRRIALVGGVVVADAADGHAQAREGLVHVHIGQARAERCRVVGAEFAQLFAAQDAHGDRRARSGGDTALGGYRDLRQDVVPFLRVGKLGGTRAPGDTRYCDGQQLARRSDLLCIYEGLSTRFSRWRTVSPASAEFYDGN